MLINSDSGLVVVKGDGCASSQRVEKSVGQETSRGFMSFGDERRASSLSLMRKTRKKLENRGKNEIKEIKVTVPEDQRVRNGSSASWDPQQRLSCRRSSCPQMTCPCLRPLRREFDESGIEHV